MAKNTLPLTVNPELFKAWQRLKRKGDPGRMAERFGLSRVPFDNALNFGYVAKDETAKFINTYFKERLDAEKASAEELNLLADAVTASTVAP